MTITDVQGFSSPPLHVLWGKKKTLKNWTAMLSAFLVSIPNGIVVPATQETRTAGWVSGPMMCTWSAPRILNMFLKVVDLPKVSMQRFEVNFLSCRVTQVGM